MRLEFLLEGPSDEVALRHIVPKIVGPEADLDYRTFGSKTDLLGKLGERLRGYTRVARPDLGIVVLVDRDADDCHELKKRVVGAAPSHFGQMTAPLLARIAVEELEAWFLGDVEAMRIAFPRLPEALAAKAPFRDPDAVSGGTWERLEKELRRHSYFRAGLNKIELARLVAPHMDPARNRSHSFRVFRDGLVDLARTLETRGRSSA